MQLQVRVPTFNLDLNFVDKSGEPHLLALIPDQAVVPNVGERIDYIAEGDRPRYVSGIVTARVFRYREGKDYRGAVVSIYADVVESSGGQYEKREWQCPLCAETHNDDCVPDHFIECSECGGIFEWEDVDALSGGAA
jgi:hypothetical protein